MSPIPAEARTPTDRDWHTDELPPLPQREFLIPAERWVEAPAALRTLGLDLGIELVAYKRRIGRYLLWRAGPATCAPTRADMAVAADDLERAIHVPSHARRHWFRRSAPTARRTRGSGRGRRRCVTTPEFPDNPFAASGVGTRYALGRPYHHPHALGARVDDARRDRCRASARRRVRHGHVDACAHRDRRRRDRCRSFARRCWPSPVRTKNRRSTGRGSCAARRSHCRSATASFDAVTVCSGIHWFDQESVLRGSRAVAASRWLGRAVRPLLHRRDGRRRRSSRHGPASRSSATRCRHATTRSAIRVARRPPGSRRSATSSTPTTSR